ncbi:unnamed protein product, partial [Mycena citricolor]
SGNPTFISLVLLMVSLVPILRPSDLDHEDLVCGNGSYSSARRSPRSSRFPDEDRSHISTSDTCIINDLERELLRCFLPGAGVAVSNVGAGDPQQALIVLPDKSRVVAHCGVKTIFMKRSGSLR